MYQTCGFEKTKSQTIENNYIMKKSPILFVLCLFLISCKDRNVSDELPSHNFCGYGVIKFSKSYNGSIRYLEFYPIYRANHPDNNLVNELNISIKNGIIIRGNNSTKLWQDLIKTNASEPDKFGYCKSLIFLDLSKSTLKYDYNRPIPNEILLQKKVFRTKTFDYVKGKLDILNYKIFQSL